MVAIQRKWAKYFAFRGEKAPVESGLNTYKLPTMDLMRFRLIFNPGNSTEINHHSKTEDTKVSTTGKFSGEIW